MDPRHATRGAGLPDPSPPAGPKTTGRRTSLVVVRDAQALLSFVPAWEELAAAAIEPNVFYEHWMLLPALRAFGSGRDISVVLVLTHDQGAGVAPKLAGLFPMERIRNFRNLKVSALSLWQHIHCYKCTPLVRADAAGECLLELYRWLQSGGANASLVELGCIYGDGPFQKKLIDLCNEHGMLSWITDVFTRGRWHKDATKAGAESAVSGDLRRRLRRKERRLSERGRVDHLVLQPQDDVGRWIDDFLRVEASGWKGLGGTALARSESGRRYFKETATSAFHLGRLLMLGIDFDGHPIARRCAFIAGEGSFAFKTAYDEEFADYSPGAMLELDSIHQLDALPGIRWMDSCASPDNVLINRISNDRQTIQTLAIGGSTLGELVVCGLPLLRWTHRQILRRKSAELKEA